MDSSGGPAAIPRLRIPRSGSNSMQDPANSSLSTQAGPSRLPDSRILDEEDIGGITPRAPMIMPLSESHGQEEIQDTPALRLRALLARVPADKSHPVAPSSPESELDAPDFGSSTMRSYAKESLASLFSHARREPGDTPLKVARGRRRRNSVDASDLESGSPRVQKVRQETRDYKGKRKSLSDEETECACLCTCICSCTNMLHSFPTQITEFAVSSSDFRYLTRKTWAISLSATERAFAAG